MKRITLAIIFACCMLALTAQDAIKVNYKGAKPTISDFAWALVSYIDNIEEECGDRPTNAIRDALILYRKGLPQEDGITFTVDEKNGYLLYEMSDDYSIYRMEMCYWNEADGKHKLFAFNNLASYDIEDGKPISTETSGLTFWRYDNATKKMTYCATPGFKVEYLDTNYALPRTGKDITVITWLGKGKKTEKTLKWNGRRFSY